MTDREESEFEANMEKGIKRNIYTEEEFAEAKKIAEQKKTSIRKGILEELSQVNTTILETPLPEDGSSTRFLQIKKEAEMEKLKSASTKLNDEAKSIREKWKKEGFDPFSEEDAEPIVSIYPGL